MISSDDYDNRLNDTLNKLDQIELAEEDHHVSGKLRMTIAISIKPTVKNAKADSSKEVHTVSIIRKDTGEIYKIDGDLSIGRDECNDIVIPYPVGEYVSANHAVIIVSGGDIRIKDRDSKNGTYVNGKRIRSKKISVGDLIEIANISFTVTRK